MLLEINEKEERLDESIDEERLDQESNIDDNNSLDESNVEQYNLSDDGITENNTNPEQRENLHRQIRNNFEAGEDYIYHTYDTDDQFQEEGKLYVYDDTAYRNNPEILEHSFARFVNNAKLQNEDTPLSLDSYKKNLLSAIGSRKYKSSYFEAASVFDGITYKLAGANIAMKLGGGKEYNESQEYKEKVAEENRKKNPQNLIYEEPKFEVKKEGNGTDTYNFKSIDEALTSFRAMERYAFNKVIGGGEARFANITLLDKTLYAQNQLSFHQRRISEFDKCISDEELINKYLDNITKDERNQLFNSVNEGMNIFNDGRLQPFQEQEMLPPASAEQVKNAIDLLSALSSYNKSRFFLTRWFSPNSWAEQNMIENLESQLKESGISQELVNQIKEGNKETIEELKETIDYHKERFVEKYGEVSLEQAIAKDNDIVIKQINSQGQVEFQNNIEHSLDENNEIVNDINNEEEKEATYDNLEKKENEEIIEINLNN